jgi:hypothetical protein
MPSVTSGVKFARAVAGSKVSGPVPGTIDPAALPDVPAIGTESSTSSSFSKTIPSSAGTPVRRVGSPATRGALPDWAIASAVLMLAASAGLLWMARARVRDWMLGVPIRR